MPDLVAVAVGAIIGVFAGPASEFVKHSLAERQRKEDRERDFQRETLLALARHLTDAHISAILVRFRLEQTGFPDEWQDDNMIAFEQNMVEVGHYAPFVANAQIRELSEQAITTAMESMQVKNAADADTKGKEAAELFRRVADSIGEKVRSL